MHTRIKICGIKRVEDARAAGALGADAIGMVFHAASPRAVSIKVACEIAAAVPPFVARVGVFLDEEEAFVSKVVRQVPLDLLQFHGEESPQACRSFGRAYIKAVPMGAATDPGQYMARYPDAIGFLVDSHRPGHMGGLGAVLDWTRVPKMRRPLILAGGLDMHNVAEALRVTRPYGVDVSSGVESARGIKDAHKIEAFISEVRRVDCHAG